MDVYANAFSNLDPPFEMSGYSQGSTTNSIGETTDPNEDVLLTPSLSDCKRLAKIKAEQEQRLKMLRTRVDRLTDSERRVWKEVMWSEHRSLQAQEAQWRRQATKAQSLRREQETRAREQALRERFRDIRSRSADLRERPRLQKFEENRALASQVREDSKRLSAALQDVREQSLKAKKMQVDLRRSQASQARLRRDLANTNAERIKQDANVVRYAALQQEIESSELAIAAAEEDERKAMSRLQNSQQVRSDVFGQLQGMRQRSLSPSPQPTSEEAPLPASLRRGNRSRGSPSRSRVLSQISEEYQEDILESSSHWVSQ